MTTHTLARYGWPSPRLARTLSLASLVILVALGSIGCKSSSGNTAAINSGTDNGGDPAEANLAPANTSAQPTQVLGASSSYTPQQQSETYQNQQPPAPIANGYNNQDPNNQNDQSYNNQDQGPAYDNQQPIDQTDQPPPPRPP
jgi:hypothetical protein